ncbi:MAG: calcium-binding protein [Actinomycetota bacterium]
MTTLDDNSNTLDLNLPGFGPDTIFAGDGADFIRSSTLGGSLIYGQGGNDTLISVGPNDTLYGGPDEDSLRGQRSPAVLAGEAGNDTIVADATATLLGGLGDDYLQGNAGGNLEFGNQGQDTLLGGSIGRDTLYGGKDNDTIGFFVAGGGSNIPGFTLTGGVAGTNEGSNYLRGDQGDDFIAGINQRDTLFGGKGNDTLQGNGSNTYLSGDEGNDTLYILSVTSPNPFGGQPFAQTADRVTLLGGAGADSIVGSIGSFGNGKNFLGGGDGNDTIVTFGTQDTVQGDAGDDFIRSVTTDILTSTGARTSFYAGKNLLDGGDGNDTIVAGFSTDTMIGGAGNDSLSGIFNQASGGDGNDTINASFLGSLTGNVTLDGGAGDDWLIGNTTGNVTNIFRPGDGNDRIIFGSANDRILSDSTAGNDTIDLTKFNVAASVTSPISVTDQFGSNFILGSNGSNVIITGNGDDILIGNNNSDTLISAGGNNLLYGGSGTDYLLGGGGNDSIIGSSGSDQMLGGLGNDSFYYFSSLEGGGAVGSTTPPDFIGDFDPNQDKLIISRAGFGINANQTAFVVPITNIASDVIPVNGVPVFIYETTGTVGNLYYDPDGGPTDNAIQLAQFTNKPASISNSIVYI